MERASQNILIVGVAFSSTMCHTIVSDVFDTPHSKRNGGVINKRKFYYGDYLNVQLKSIFVQEHNFILSGRMDKHPEER
jgi:hypothetical protein